MRSQGKHLNRAGLTSVDLYVTSDGGSDLHLQGSMHPHEPHLGEMLDAEVTFYAELTSSARILSGSTSILIRDFLHTASYELPRGSAGQPSYGVQPASQSNPSNPSNPSKTSCGKITAGTEIVPAKYSDRLRRDGGELQLEMFSAESRRKACSGQPHPAPQTAKAHRDIVPGLALFLPLSTSSRPSSDLVTQRIIDIPRNGDVFFTVRVPTARVTDEQRTELPRIQCPSIGKPVHGKSLARHLLHCHSIAISVFSSSTENAASAPDCD